jgi:hypothetical protein
MKNHRFLLISAGVLALGLAGCASSGSLPLVSDHTLHLDRSPDPGPAFPVDDGTAAVLSQLRVAAPVEALDKDGVLQMFGRPAQRLTPNLWVYWRYCSPEQAEQNGGHDTLVVAFAPDEQVAGMKLVDGDLLRKHLDGRRYRTASTQL